MSEARPPVFVVRWPDMPVALYPGTNEDVERISRIKPGVRYAVSLKRSRNPGNHRRFFALVQLVAERHPVYDTPDKALTAIKIAAGFVDFHVSPIDGTLVAVPKSISFKALDDEEDFRFFFEAAITGVLNHILPEFSREDIDRCFESVMRFA
jgi:hypothetical protein